MAKKNFAEDWMDTYKRYLGSINFTAGDFDSLKQVIREYVVRQNPEGYNDWQESSEVGMFVNAIAYLGENINYRVDLNVNDLFPSTTTRKQSLINFTKMLSYESKRNICANGLAKLTSISTTQDVQDTEGNLLQNITINWNDASNPNWLEQFLTILNSALIYTNPFGRPIKKISINNISNQLYQFTNLSGVPTLPFKSIINTHETLFEVFNPDIDTKNKTIVERTPAIENAMNLLYRNDGAGNNSINTGFFMSWKQGQLGSQVFNFTEKIENNKIDIDTENINNNDVWFGEIDPLTGYLSKSWTQVAPGEQLSYTNTQNNVRTIYKVETQENDKISLKFTDGFFGDIPYGLYRMWYRTSDGNKGLYIKPSDIQNVTVKLPYLHNTNATETNVYYLTMTFSVMDISHINQAVPTESLEKIRENAPDVYSTQDRMVSGKDYTYFPKSIGQMVRVLNSIERTYSGNSRYIDLNDPTGRYDNVKTFASDGYLYMDNDYIRSTIPMGSLRPDAIISKYIEDSLSLKEVANMYYQYYDGMMIPRDLTESPRDEDVQYYYWQPIMVDGLNIMDGYLLEGRKDDPNKVKVSYNNLVNDIGLGDLICFQEFIFVEDSQGIKHEQDTDNIVWAKVFKLEEEKSQISISEILDINKHWKIRKGNADTKQWSKYANFNTHLDNQIYTEIYTHLTDGETTTFGLTYHPEDVADNKENGYSQYKGRWMVVEDSEQLKSDTPQMVLDQTSKILNWFIRVTYDSEINSWTFDTQRSRIIFGSEEDVSFFFNTSVKNKNNKGYFLTNDIIKILKEDNNLRRDYYWKPYNVIKYSDGYINPQEFCCEAYDGDKDDTIDYPTQLTEILINPKNLIFLHTTDVEKQYLDYNDLYSKLNTTVVDINTTAYECSLWGKTTLSGYYYSYHKINEVIGAGKISRTENTKFYNPKAKNVLLSNGVIVPILNGEQVEITENHPLEYDFVDYIKGYDKHGTPLFYDDVDEEQKPIHGYLYYYNGQTKGLTLIDKSKYTKLYGQDKLTFLWKHWATEDYLIDPCSTNIIDMFVQTADYYNSVQKWVKDGKKDTFPKAPNAYELKSMFATLEDNKMISDTIVWHPVTYKLLFGASADVDTHCIFKVIKRNDLISDNEVKKQVITLIDEFFKDMGVGETFYFTQLSTYIENRIPELLKTVVIVPTDTSNKFGNLFQVVCGENEILLSAATLDDVQIISTITEQNIRAI